MNITPHAVQNTKGRRSAIDRRMNAIRGVCLSWKMRKMRLAFAAKQQSCSSMLSPG
jgi:hypothetical protein